MSPPRSSNARSLRQRAHIPKPHGSTAPMTARPRTFVLEIRLRGQIGFVQKTNCTGLEGALRFGQTHFAVFAERNPWIGQDWEQHKIWILLDPEPASTR